VHSHKIWAQRKGNPAARKTPRTRTHDASNQRSPIKTTGEVFSDGASIELILDAETGRLNLLISDGENYTIAPRVEYGGRVYVPADLDRSILRALTWPTKCTPYGSTDQLFTAVRDSFTNHSLPEEVALRTTYSVFATWFPECVPAAPCLSITGPRPEARLILQLLGCLCRHPLPLAEVSRAGLCSLLTHLQPTLLIDLEHLGPSILRLLAASNDRKAYVPWKNSLVNLYCAKAIYRGDALGDGLFSDATLQVNLAPSRGRLPILDASTLQEIATALQPQLLAYRSRNIAKVHESQFDLPAFASPIRILARVLGACLIDAPELQAGLGPLLEAHQEKIHAERWLDLRCVALEALLFHCHSGQTNLVYVGEFTRSATTILKGRGETVSLEPRAMGPILRSFGLSPKRDSKGWAIRLTHDVRRRIHRLAGDYEVAAMQEGMALCADCAEIVAGGDTQNGGESTFEEEG
jgi:hypothetical protein